MGKSTITSKQSSKKTSRPPDLKKNGDNYKEMVSSKTTGKSHKILRKSTVLKKRSDDLAEENQDGFLIHKTESRDEGLDTNEDSEDSGAVSENGNEEDGSPDDLENGHREILNGNIKNSVNLNSDDNTGGEEDEDREDAEGECQESDDKGSDSSDEHPDCLVYHIGKLPDVYGNVELDLTRLFFEKDIGIRRLWSPRNRNFCFCVLAKAEDKRKMKALDGLLWKDTCLKVKLAPTVEVYNKQKLQKSVDFFVGNLPANLENVEVLLTAFFERKGVRVTDIRGEKDKKFCHCSLVDANEEVRMALLNGEVFNGSSLTIHPALHETGRREPHKLILHGVDLRLIKPLKLKKLTGAIYVKITRSRSKRGIAILTFADEEKAKEILDLEHVELNGCKMPVDVAISWSSADAARDAKKRRRELDADERVKRERTDLGERYKTVVGKGGNQPCYLCGAKGHTLADCTAQVRI